jgi:hypothetical protein
VDLELGPLSLVSTIVKLLRRNSSGSGLERRDYGIVGIRCAGHAKPLSPQKLAVTSPTSGGRSVDTVLSLTQFRASFRVCNNSGHLICHNRRAKCSLL